jgi:hypothetical protein
MASQASFRWVPTTERSPSGSGLPLFGISFPDGDTEDFVELENTFGSSSNVDNNNVNNDDCIFQGFLKNEPDVLVSVNGCPFSDSLDVSFES